MHGLGNDFVVIDLITQGARLQKNQIVRIADRKFGIGCDQVILITPPTKPETDFFYRIFNADGQEVEQCGNGLRCAAKFFRDSGLSNKSTLLADCLAGLMTVNLEDNNLIKVNLGTNYTAVTPHKLSYPGLPEQIYAVSVGNPHGVCFVDDLNSTPVIEWGKKLTNDNIFPQGANISFVQIMDRSRVKVRVYERGVGPTLACGSAACAILLAGKSLNLLDHKAYVMFQHGELCIELNNNNLIMSGSASSTFIGRFRI